jgi:hypothetical protein
MYFEEATFEEPVWDGLDGEPARGPQRTAPGPAAVLDPELQDALWSLRELAPGDHALLAAVRRTYSHTTFAMSCLARADSRRDEVIGPDGKLHKMPVDLDRFPVAGDVDEETGRRH